MLEKLSEIQALIKWCKKNKVKSFKNGDLSFELSDYAFIEDLDISQEPIQEEILDQKEAVIFEETQSKEDDEDLLFWSSNS